MDLELFYIKSCIFKLWFELQVVWPSSLIKDETAIIKCDSIIMYQWVNTIKGNHQNGVTFEIVDEKLVL
jgi:hypothetical protein